jgi:dihydroneopterin aldolase
LVIEYIEIKNLTEASSEIAKIGADKVGCQVMAPKAVFRVIKIKDLTATQALILKQEMLSQGGEAAVARGVISGAVSHTDVLLMGTLKQYAALLIKLKQQSFGLAALAGQIQEKLKSAGDFINDCFPPSSTPESDQKDKEKDRICLQGMQFYAYHGASAPERELGQRLEVDVEIYSDLRAAGKLDDLVHTVNYTEVYQVVQEVVTNSSYNLIEALAEAVAAAILARFNVAEILVRIKKPGPFIPGCLSGVAVEIHRYQ